MDKLPVGHYTNMIQAIRDLENAHNAQYAAVHAAIEETAKQRDQRYHKMRQDHALNPPERPHASHL